MAEILKIPIDGIGVYDPERKAVILIEDLPLTPFTTVTTVAVEPKLKEVGLR